MRKIRCLFYVSSVEDKRDGEGNGGLVVGCHTQYGEAQEDREFSTATPWGQMSFGVDNPAVLDAFLPGGEFAQGRSFYLEMVEKPLEPAANAG